MARRNQEFQAIRSEGGLLPASLLRRVLERNTDLVGTQPENYGLPADERLNEVITQSWTRLLKHWTEFREAAENLPEGEAATGLTNDRWNLPLLRELGFGLLPSGAGPEIEGRTYAISRFAGPVPVHLIGCGLSLDRRSAGQRGAAAVNPHGLVQEFLNRSEAHLWGVLSNGLRLRVLRDNQALSRQSFLEFDLEAMMDGEVYSDFVLLWLVAHATRFAPREDDRPDTCLLEQWTQEAEQEGVRALGKLRDGVEQALRTLGEGFTKHKKNTELLEALRSGKLAPTELHAQLLRLVYRLIFLFVAEDRTLEGHPLIHPLDSSPESKKAQERYATHYSTGRLREMAGKIKGSRHGDLWQQFKVITNALSGGVESEAIRTLLALPALGSFLWDPESTSSLNDAELTNFDLLKALRHLAFTRDGKILRPVDYKNLGAEELGGIYESLLALTPQVGGDGASFSFVEYSGNERKTSGSYYTPDSLVQCLLDSALNPVIESKIKDKSPQEAEEAILSLKVCDPSVGSAHFLVGAAHRLARHLARVRALAEGESEPSPLLHQQALRDVIGRCLYGVDINPMAAELCRVSLWLEALEPGKPLSFLDHHIQVGNSFLGTVPQLEIDDLPDDAFNAIEGDDRDFCTGLKKRNRKERDGKQIDLSLPMAAEDSAGYEVVASRSQEIDQAPDDDLEAIAWKATKLHELKNLPAYRNQLRIDDSWCAAFVWPKSAKATEPITTDTIQKLRDIPDTLSVKQQMKLEELVKRFQFFHWGLAFPEVFENGGFDCVLGNPPWERIKIQEKEFFASRSAEIAEASNAAARNSMIQQLNSESATPEEQALHWEFRAAKRQADATSLYARASGRFPLTSVGDLNTYPLFTETFLNLINSSGRAGLIVPTGIATDNSTKAFFEHTISEQRLVSLFDFENREALFPNVHRSYKFCLLTLGGEDSQISSAKFAFFLYQPEHLKDKKRRFSLSSDDFALFNPNTRTCPLFRAGRDMEIARKMYQRAGVFWREGDGQEHEHNPWGVKFSTMFHMANNSDLFRKRMQLESEGWELQGNVFVRGEERYVPLYEAKLFHQYDHRFATFDGVSGKDIGNGNARSMPSETKTDHSCAVIPRYWVPEEIVEKRLDICENNIQWLAEPSRAEPSRAEPSRAEPSRAEPSRAEPSRAEPSRAEPSRAEPSRAVSPRASAHYASDGSQDNNLCAHSQLRIGQQSRHPPHRSWQMALRLITNATNQRTLIASLIPRVALGHKGAVIHILTGSYRSERQPTQPTNEPALRPLSRESE